MPSGKPTHPPSIHPFDVAHALVALLENEGNAVQAGYLMTRVFGMA
jgi:hypothetical protein